MATVQTDPILHKIAQDEPIFILRGQDVLAPETIDYWCDYAEEQAAPGDKIAEARALARHMRDWQQHNPCKLPD